jgi:hypothetical protein
MSISLCMIVKDEAENLPRCLESVQNLVHECIVVDTGSTDATCDIATSTEQGSTLLPGTMILRPPATYPWTMRREIGC